MGLRSDSCRARNTRQGKRLYSRAQYRAEPRRACSHAYIQADTCSGQIACSVDLQDSEQKGRQRRAEQSGEHTPGQGKSGRRIDARSADILERTAPDRLKTKTGRKGEKKSSVSGRPQAKAGPEAWPQAPPGHRASLRPMGNGVGTSDLPQNDPAKGENFQKSPEMPFGNREICIVKNARCILQMNLCVIMYL